MANLPDDTRPEPVDLLAGLMADQRDRTERGAVLGARDDIDEAMTANYRLTGDATMNDDEMRHYSRALDEIYKLRQMLAYEARVVEVTLDYKTFPKSRRAFHEAQVERMRAATHSPATLIVSGFSHGALRACMRESEMPGTLTRSQWEEESA